MRTMILMLQLPRMQHLMPLVAPLPGKQPVDTDKLKHIQVPNTLGEWDSGGMSTLRAAV